MKEVSALQVKDRGAVLPPRSWIGAATNERIGGLWYDSDTDSPY